jgi:hypothetical protein
MNKWQLESQLAKFESLKIFTNWVPSQCYTSEFKNNIHFEFCQLVVDYVAALNICPVMCMKKPGGAVSIKYLQKVI